MNQRTFEITKYIFDQTFIIFDTLIKCSKKKENF